MTMPATLVITVSLLLARSCGNPAESHEALRQKVDKELAAIDGDVALAFYDLSDSTNTILVRENESFHAASTMKVPVMIELYKQADTGRIRLDDSIMVKNEFRSIVDGSPYQLATSDDSDDRLYTRLGSWMTLRELMEPMITVSSNLATNILIELADARKVTATMRDLGAKDIRVLRGVEDQKAYDRGLSNSTTALDLMVIMKAIATHNAGTPKACEEMISLLKQQEFNTMIPRYLPKEVQVAHKTGFITGVHHDAAIVYLPDGRAYVLVLLSKNLKDFDKGTTQLAGIANTIYEYMMAQGKLQVP